MASQQTLRDQLAAKGTQVDLIVHQISIIVSSIHSLSQKFISQSAKVHHRLNKVSFSRPRGSPSNQKPHCPMTERVCVFHQFKNRKERELQNNKAMLQQVFDQEKAILTSKRAVLEAEKHDIESQMKMINIKLNQPVNYDF